MSSQELVAQGIVLREQVQDWLTANKVKKRQLSRDIGCKPNYLQCYLSRDAQAWSVPKAPTFGRLLSAIGLSQEDLEFLARQKMDC